MYSHCSFHIYQLSVAASFQRLFQLPKELAHLKAFLQIYEYDRMSKLLLLLDLNLLQEKLTKIQMLLLLQ